jgi:hypothetical protein
MQLTISPVEINNYYVYMVKNNQELIHINADKLTNIVNFSKLLSHSDFDINALYTVEIFGNHSMLHNALNDCDKLAKLYGLPKYTKSNFGKRIRCNETGVIFKNAKEACDCLNLQPSRLSMHLNNQRGNRTIKGLTFSYI